MATEAWVVLTAKGAAYTESYRGPADSWFDAVSRVYPESRGVEMFAVKLADIHFVHMIQGQQELPDAEVVKVQPDGSLKRVRAADPVDG